MSTIARRGFHYMQRLNSANVSPALLEKAQNHVIDAALAFIRERAKFKVSSNFLLLSIYRYEFLGNFMESFSL